ncbi:hypothetical protein [Aeromicrobium chenweiae]|uniref:Uncharacterized protein n=1 Tax=Aeromicrobium chenweiae TaxID=2079793 RepID=A0A2S0WM73_9ACTN|nr:hypothetical protein [Aeromicrobium chenweiae]AWB92370.1 hypothetical protein C3E78_09240 [Aeromicrobium chenweiae]TGN31342.1 hypothetical protein E4L97_13330 [Aeromicrobium chenweiae]
MSTHENVTSPTIQPVSDWADLGREMWSYLTGKGAAVSYEFVDMEIEVPRDTGPQAPRATWKVSGTLRVTTSDDPAAGADRPGE